MGVDRSYVAENNAQRERLRALVGRLTDQELSRPMSGGWTVSAVLAHLAFWDQRVVTLLERWRRAGPSAVPAPVADAAVGWINDAAKPMFLAMPARRAAELALAIAEDADRALEALPDEFVAANQAAGGPLNLLRARHRREHLEEIETAVGR